MAIRAEAVTASIDDVVKKTPTGMFIVTQTLLYNGSAVYARRGQQISVAAYLRIRGMYADGKLYLYGGR